MAAADDAPLGLREARDRHHEILREIRRLAHTVLSKGPAAVAQAELKIVIDRAKDLRTLLETTGQAPDAGVFFKRILAVTKLTEFDVAYPEHQLFQLIVLVVLLQKASWELYDKTETSSAASSDTDQGDGDIMKLAESIIQEVMAEVMARRACARAMPLVVRKIFIVFDGIIACGKSTSLDEIQKTMPGGVKVVREPVESAWRKLLAAFYKAVESLKTKELSKRQACGEFISLPRQCRFRLSRQDVRT